MVNTMGTSKHDRRSDIVPEGGILVSDLFCSLHIQCKSRLLIFKKRLRILKGGVQEGKSPSSLLFQRISPSSLLFGAISPSSLNMV